MKDWGGANYPSLPWVIQENFLICLTSPSRQGKGCVINSQAATHKSWLVRCSPYTPGSSRNNIPE